MRFYCVLIASIVFASCGRTTEKVVTEPKNDFQLLVSNLKQLEKGFTYNLVKEDTEGCYTPDKNADSLFYNPPYPILGVLTSDTNIYSIIHFEPGDDMWPILRTFDENGVEIDRETISIGLCAAGDCGFDECDEYFKVVDNHTIEDILTYVIIDCDSVGKEIAGTTKKIIRRQVVTVDSNGDVIVKEYDESNKLIEVEVKSNFGDELDLGNYLAEGNVDEKDLLEISESIALLIYPTHDQIEEMKKEYGEEDFYTVADDNSYYQGTAIGMIDSFKVNTTTAKSRFIRFIGREKKNWTLDIRKNGAPPWNVIFFHKDKDPEIISTIDLTHEKIQSYFEK